MKKESILTKEGVFGCDVFNFHFWKQRRSTLLWRVVFTAVGISRWILWCRFFFSKRSWFLQRQRKTSRFWCYLVIFEIDRHSQQQRKTVFVVLFFQRNRKLKLFFVVSDQAFSILPMIFLSCPSWRCYCRGLRRFPGSLFPPWDRLVECYCDQIQTTGVGKMLRRKRRFSSSG